MVLGIGVIQTTGWVQGALTIFVIIFPLLIAGGFFAILWFKPFVLYPPSEFSQQDVNLYVKAMQTKAAIDDSQVYATITSAIQSTLTSEETVQLLQSKSRASSLDTVEVTRLLQDVADSTVERVNERAFIDVVFDDSITSYRSHISENPGATNTKIAASSKTNSAKFLYEVAALTTAVTVRASTYGKTWALRDRATGMIITDLPATTGDSLSQAAAKAPLLRETSIRPGMMLEAFLL